jgi:FKBP-type peptidyl-prolyl cis-trans isomerase
MKTSRKILFACMAALAAASCNKELDATYEQQEGTIASIVQSFLKADSTHTVSHQDGSTRVTVVQGSGEKLQEGGAVSFFYAGHYLSGTSLSASNLFATNYDVYARSANWNLSDTTAFTVATVKLSDSELVDGLRKGLIGVQGGEECYILFSGMYGFAKNKTFGLVPANAALAYHLWIQSVSNE